MSTEAMKLQEIMSQAQVFASAWSLVGGRFDGGNAMDEAEVAKNELHQMVAEALAQPQQGPDLAESFRAELDKLSQRNYELRMENAQLRAQPQQEPVAWANPNDLQNFDLKVRTNGGPLHTVPLYTSPPAQEFVCSTGLCHYRKPLTDEDITYLWAHIPEPSLRKALNIFARAVEAAHGIKGGA